MRNLHPVALLRVALFSVALTSANTLYAGLIVKAVHNEVPVKGATVCYYPGGPPDEILESGLRGGEVQCGSADTEISIPPGWWSVYVDAGELTSAHPQMIRIGTGPGRFPLTIPLVESATVEFPQTAARTGSDAEWFAYYDNNGRDASPGFRPLRAGATAVRLPAGSAVLPMLIRSGTPVRTGATIRDLEAGMPAKVSPLATESTLLIPITIARNLPGDVKQAIRASKSVPQVRLVQLATGKAFAPEIPLRPAPDFHRSLLVFRALSAGEYELVLDGALWKEARQRIRVGQNRAITLERNVVVAAPASRITAAYSLDQRLLPSSDTNVCDAAPQDAAEPALLVRKCPENWRGPSAACEVVHSRTLTSSTEVESFEMPPEGGSFLVEIRAGAIRWAEQVALEAVSERRLTLAPELTLLSGRVTKGREPVRAYVRFRTASAVTEETTGEYQAHFAEVSRWSPVTVTACDGSWRYDFIPDRDLMERSTLDIAVPDNVLRFRVIDARDGTPLPAAKVLLHAMGDEDKRVEVAHRSATTDEAGAAEMRMLPVEREIEVCAFLSGYRTECLGDLVVGADERRELQLGLVPNVMRKGRVISPPAPNLSVWLISRGTVKDRASVAPDGTFIVHAPASGDFLVVASPMLPLRLFRQQSPEGEELILRYEHPGIREITIRNQSPSPLWWTLDVDGVRLPADLLRTYVVTTRVGPHSSLRVGMLPADGDILVVGFFSADRDLAQAFGGGDPFITPALNSLVRTIRPDANGVAEYFR
jgi:hypothetical protein